MLRLHTGIHLFTYQSQTLARLAVFPLCLANGITILPNAAEFVLDAQSHKPRVHIGIHRNKVVHIRPSQIIFHHQCYRGTGCSLNYVYLLFCQGNGHGNLTQFRIIALSQGLPNVLSLVRLQVQSRRHQEG